MNLDEYQQEALVTASNDGLRSERLAILGLGVTGEAGEVADLIKKHVGHKHPLKADELAKELGDVLWYVAVLASEAGFFLSHIADKNIEKLRARYPNGFSSEASMARVDTKTESE